MNLFLIFLSQIKSLGIPFPSTIFQADDFSQSILKIQFIRANPLMKIFFKLHLSITYFFDMIDLGDKVHKFCIILQGIKSFKPVLSDEYANRVLFHVCVDVKLITYFCCILHEVLIDVFFGEDWWTS